MGRELDDRPPFGRYQICIGIVSARGESITNLQIHEIRVFVTGNYVTKSAEHGKVVNDGTHGRVQIIYGAFEINNMIKSELQGQEGRSMILCECIGGNTIGIANRGL
jgi:tRNA pseudouridine-54 N-methylase